jgi:hypothetical protein
LVLLFLIRPLPSSFRHSDQPFSSSQSLTVDAMEGSSGWTKYLNLLGILGILSAIMYINPLSGDPAAILSQAPFLAHANDFLKRTIGFGIRTPAESFLAKYRDGCPPHYFSSVKIVSRAPDIIVIEGFLSKEEAEYLVNFA